MHMLEQQQRQGAALVEQLAVAFLHVHHVTAGQLVEQRDQRSALLGADLAGAADGIKQLLTGALQRLGRIIQQQGNHLEDLHAHSSHSCTVFSTSRRLAFFAPNILVSELPLQPLPKLKPQPERSAKASLMASSRCAVGITKRSS